MNKIATTAVAAVMVAGLAAVATTSDAAGPAGSAGSERSKHVVRLVSQQVESHRVSDNHPSGVDRLRSFATHKIVGYESFSGVFDPRTDQLRFWLSAALKGGMVDSYFNVNTETTGNRFAGLITHGTGRYRGIEGTIHVRNTASGRTVYTLRYHL